MSPWKNGELMSTSVIGEDPSLSLQVALPKWYDPPNILVTYRNRGGALWALYYSCKLVWTNPRSVKPIYFRIKKEVKKNKHAKELYCKTNQQHADTHAVNKENASRNKNKQAKEGKTSTR